MALEPRLFAYPKDRLMVFEPLPLLAAVKVSVFLVIVRLELKGLR